MVKFIYCKNNTVFKFSKFSVSVVLKLVKTFYRKQSFKVGSNMFFFNKIVFLKLNFVQLYIIRASFFNKVNVLVVA